MSVWTRTRRPTKRVGVLEASRACGPARPRRPRACSGAGSRRRRRARRRTSRETASQSSIVTGEPSPRSSTRRRTENRPAPPDSTASSRQPFSAAIARISFSVPSLKLAIEQKSGPRPASFSSRSRKQVFSIRSAGLRQRAGAGPAANPACAGPVGRAVAEIRTGRRNRPVHAALRQGTDVPTAEDCVLELRRKTKKTRQPSPDRFWDSDESSRSPFAFRLPSQIERVEPRRPSLLGLEGLAAGPLRRAAPPGRTDEPLPTRIRPRSPGRSRATPMPRQAAAPGPRRSRRTPSILGLTDIGPSSLPSVRRAIRRRGMPNPRPALGVPRAWRPSFFGMGGRVRAARACRGAGEPLLLRARGRLHTPGPRIVRGRTPPRRARSRSMCPEFERDVEHRAEPAFPLERAILLSLARPRADPSAAPLAARLGARSAQGSARGLRAAARSPTTTRSRSSSARRPGPSARIPRSRTLSDADRRAGGGDPSKPKADSPFVAAAARASEGLAPGAPRPASPPRRAAAGSARAAGRGAGRSAPPRETGKANPRQTSRCGRTAFVVPKPQPEPGPRPRAGRPRPRRSRDCSRRSATPPRASAVRGRGRRRVPQSERRLRRFRPALLRHDLVRLGAVRGRDDPAHQAALGRPGARAARLEGKADDPLLHPGRRPGRGRDDPLAVRTCRPSTTPRSRPSRRPPRSGRSPRTWKVPEGPGRSHRNLLLQHSSRRRRAASTQN